MSCKGCAYSEGDLYRDGLERFPMGQVIVKNALLMAILAIGFAGLYPIQVAGIPVVSIGYLLVTLVVFFVSKSYFICSNCYYYGKRCHTAHGLLAAKMFRRNAGSADVGFKISNAYLFGVMVIGVTGTLVVLAYLAGWTALSIALPVANVVAIFTLAGLIRTGCLRCKMRYVCQGSFAKGRGHDARDARDAA